MTKRLLLLFICVALAVPLFAGDGKIRKNPKNVPGRYIVAFPAGTSSPEILASDLAKKYHGIVEHVFRIEPTGFVLTCDEKTAERISSDAAVRYVEEIAEGVDGETSSVRNVGASGPDGKIWHLDRVDQQTLPLDNLFLYCGRGAGALAYVVDTGVLGIHSELAGKVDGGVDILDNCMGACSNLEAVWPCAHMSAFYGDTVYTAGHGTAVASLIAGNTFGVAPDAAIRSVRVADCYGVVESDKVATGLDWILTSCGGGLNPPACNPDSSYRPSLANMSFYFWSNGDPDPTFVEEKIDALVNNGITVIVSANNQNDYAQNYSPSRLARSGGGNVITVGGLGIPGTSDFRWEVTPGVGPEHGSNWGPYVDLFAPAEAIRSAGFDPKCVWTNADGSRPKAGCDPSVERQSYTSGTSFSAPIVSSAVAAYLGLFHYLDPNNFARTVPDQTWDYIRNNATTNQSPFSPPPYTTNRRLYLPGACP